MIKYYEFLANGEHTLPNGQVLTDWWSAWGWTNGTETSYGEPVRQSYWAENALRSTSTKIYDMWRETTGWDLPSQAYKEQGTLTYNNFAVRLMPAMDEDLRMIRTSVGEVVVAESWKMIYAEDETEFYELLDGMREKCVALGLETIEQWGIDSWAAASEAFAKYDVK